MTRSKLEHMSVPLWQRRRIRSVGILLTFMPPQKFFKQRIALWLGQRRWGAFSSTPLGNVPLIGPNAIVRLGRVSRIALGLARRTRQDALCCVVLRRHIGGRSRQAAQQLSEP